MHVHVDVNKNKNKDEDDNKFKFKQDIHNVNVNDKMEYFYDKKSSKIFNQNKIKMNIKNTEEDIHDSDTDI